MDTQGYHARYRVTYYLGDKKIGNGVLGNDFRLGPFPFHKIYGIHALIGLDSGIQINMLRGVEFIMERSEWNKEKFIGCKLYTYNLLENNIYDTVVTFEKIIWPEEPKKKDGWFKSFINFIFP